METALVSSQCRVFAFIAQLAEHALSKRKVTSSILVEGSLIRYGVVGNISACHADARGSIPRFGVFIFFLLGHNFVSGYVGGWTWLSTLCPSG